MQAGVRNRPPNCQCLGVQPSWCMHKCCVLCLLQCCLKLPVIVQALRHGTARAPSVQLAGAHTSCRHTSCRPLYALLCACLMHCGTANEACTEQLVSGKYWAVPPARWQTVGTVSRELPHREYVFLVHLQHSHGMHQQVPLGEACCKGAPRGHKAALRSALGVHQGLCMEVQAESKQQAHCAQKCEGGMTWCDQG